MVRDDDNAISNFLEEILREGFRCGILSPEISSQQFRHRQLLAESSTSDSAIEGIALADEDHLNAKNPNARFLQETVTPPQNESEIVGNDQEIPPPDDPIPKGALKGISPGVVWHYLEQQPFWSKGFTGDKKAARRYVVYMLERMMDHGFLKQTELFNRLQFEKLKDRLPVSALAEIGKRILPLLGTRVSLDMEMLAEALPVEVIVKSVTLEYVRERVLAPAAFQHGLTRILKISPPSRPQTHPQWISPPPTAQPDRDSIPPSVPKTVPPLRHVWNWKSSWKLEPGKTFGAVISTLIMVGGLMGFVGIYSVVVPNTPPKRIQNALHFAPPPPVATIPPAQEEPERASAPSAVPTATAPPTATVNQRPRRKRPRDVEVEDIRNERELEEARKRSTPVLEPKEGLPWGEPTPLPPAELKRKTP